MRLDTVDFPDTFIDDLLNDKVVVFAGAGVSIANPSCLPNFLSLFEKVKGCRARADEKQDLFKAFEKLENNDSSTRDKLRETLKYKSQSGKKVLSKHNKNHETVMRLFPNTDRIKVVTTNFDLHLSSSINSVYSDTDVAEYMQPALPRGDNFSGLVYLHGCLRQDLSDLIITEKDVAQAYVKYARTTAFLRELFDHYTVLFIGHSHNDPFLNLIAKSDDLFGGKRFILTEKGRRKDWEKLNITPIEYEKGQHQKSWVALELLSGFLSFSRLDNADFITDISGKSPNDLVPHESGWIKYLVSRHKESGSYLKIFVNHAQSLEWLIWAKDNNILDCIFDPVWKTDKEQKQRIHYLSFWFSETFARDYAFSDTCLEIVEEYSAENANPLLVRNISLSIFRSKDSALLKRWRLFIVRTYRQYNFLKAFDLSALFSDIDPKDEKDLSLSLFEFLTEPQPTKDTYQIVSYFGDTHWIHKAWTNYYQHDLSGLWHDLFLISTRNLSKLQSIYGDKRFPGVLLFDLNRDDIGSFLVTVTRDILIFMLKNKALLGQGFREEWLRFDDSNILHRIAKSVSENGNLVEERPTSRGGWVNHQSPVDKEYLLERSPAECADLLLNWDEISREWLENSVIEVGRDGLSSVIEAAIGESFEWSVQFAEFIKSNDAWEQHSLGETLFKGWNKAFLSQSQWEKVFEFISDNPVSISKCNDPIVGLINEGISTKEAPIPKELYLPALDVLKECIRKSTVESYLVEKNENWLSAAINSPSGKAAEAIFYIIARSKDSWTTETLKQNLDEYIQPVINSRSPTYEIALPIWGSRLFFFFVWERVWFEQNLLPIMRWNNTERERTIKLWHGFVYSYECNAGFYELQREVFMESFNIKNAQEVFAGNEDNKYSESSIKEGYAKLIALLLVRSVLWADDVSPIGSKWIKQFVDSSDVHLISRVLWDIQERLHREKEVGESSEQIWNNVILPILAEVRDSGANIDYSIFEPTLEMLPFLESVFPMAVEFISENIKTNISEDYAHPRLYREMKKSGILTSNPESGFSLISYLMKEEYSSFQWDMDEVFDCLRTLHEAGIDSSKIKDMVEQLIFPHTPQAAKTFTDSLPEDMSFSA